MDFFNLALFWKTLVMYKPFLWQISWLKTLYFNFKVLPLKYAIKVPFIVARNVNLQNIGNIIVECDIHWGLFSIGVMRNPTLESPKDVLIWKNDGTIILKGRIKIHPGVKLNTKKGATLELEGINTIGARTILVAWKYICIGHNSGCSWDCQIVDTDFHEVMDMVSNTKLKIATSIEIGENVFIGNHVGISKGSKIPDGCMISAYSNVSGNYKKDGTYLLITGNPAKVVDKGYTILNGSALNIFDN